MDNNKKRRKQNGQKKMKCYRQKRGKKMKKEINREKRK